MRSGPTPSPGGSRRCLGRRGGARVRPDARFLRVGRGDGPRTGTPRRGCSAWHGDAGAGTAAPGCRVPGIAGEGSRRRRTGSPPAPEARGTCPWRRRAPASGRDRRRRFALPRSFPPDLLQDDPGVGHRIAVRDAGDPDHPVVPGEARGRGDVGPGEDGPLTHRGPPGVPRGPGSGVGHDLDDPGGSRGNEPGEIQGVPESGTGKGIGVGPLDGPAGVRRRVPRPGEPAGSHGSRAHPGVLHVSESHHDASLRSEEIHPGGGGEPDRAGLDGKSPRFDVERSVPGHALSEQVGEPFPDVHGIGRVGIDPALDADRDPVPAQPESFRDRVDGEVAGQAVAVHRGGEREIMGAEAVPAVYLQRRIGREAQRGIGADGDGSLGAAEFGVEREFVRLVRYEPRPGIDPDHVIRRIPVEAVAQGVQHRRGGPARFEMRAAGEGGMAGDLGRVHGLIECEDDGFPGADEPLPWPGEARDQAWAGGEEGPGAVLIEPGAVDRGKPAMEHGPVAGGARQPSGDHVGEGAGSEPAIVAIRLGNDGENSPTRLWRGVGGTHGDDRPVEDHGDRGPTLDPALGKSEDHAERVAGGVDGWGRFAGGGEQ